MERFLVISFVFWMIVVPVAAQTECELTLTKAQEEFDAGRFHGVPAMLQECLAKNQNREWEQRAYLLLAETYLLLEDNAKADESYLNVLKANPEYLTDETRDPIDLVYLSKRFTATPIFSVTGNIGLNTSFISVIHDVDLNQENTTGIPVDEKYSLQVGWQGALGLDYHYKPQLTISAEAQFASTTFSHATRNMFNEGGYFQDFTDRQTWINIPILIKYTHGVKTLRPFGSFGYVPGFLLRDRAVIIIDGDKESEVIDFKYKRNTYNGSLLVGAGLKYKWGLRYIFGEVRYSIGLKNLANPRTRYDYYEGVNNQRPYVDDDFRMNNLFVSIGYVHPFYKARKLKKARTHSVLRKTKKSDAKDN